MQNNIRISCQRSACIICAVFAIICLSQAFSFYAVNEEAFADNTDIATSPTLAPDQSTLQHDTNTLAQIIATLLEQHETRQEQIHMMTKALDALYLRTPHVQYTLWEGTTLLHSPLNPEAQGINFGAHHDEATTLLVNSMVQEKEMGIYQTVAFPLAGTTHSLQTYQNLPKEQIVYAKSIPHSPWHLAALVPARQTAKGALFLPNEKFFLGYSLVGLSFMGMAGLLRKQSF